MSRKKKEKEELFEKEVFQDVQSAKEYLTKCEETHKMKLILTGISAIGTVLGILPMPSFIAVLTIPAMIIGVIAAFIVSGFSVLKFPLKLTKFCWFIVPFFPADLLGALTGFILGIMAVVGAPVLVCLYGLKQSKNNCDAAREYISLFDNQQFAEPVDAEYVAES